MVSSGVPSWYSSVLNPLKAEVIWHGRSGGEYFVCYRGR
jgi:hypothetical protein